MGLVLTALTLAAGLIIGRWLGATPENIVPQGAETFRTWFWAHRSIDLGVQIGLIFAGALGVAAVLPSAREEEP
ncbi:MAG: hypothetical protein P1S60_13915 [Anaerolineae bacterium]|nr:hypothetical protein [Anaerolineae bacterium]